jgi:hypothetical protein
LRSGLWVGKLGIAVNCSEWKLSIVHFVEECKGKEENILKILEVHVSMKEYVKGYLSEYLFKEANRREGVVHEFSLEVSKLYQHRA